ncbi:hypothetical protein ACQPXM_19330 [Kribbella sp. CA-253562]|uniref:hypothetical protein n=1 Tax=Kribbella sp. CA-253562 TaxID=3239942 RepID=UPI003D8B5330
MPTDALTKIADALRAWLEPDGVAYVRGNTGGFTIDDGEVTVEVMVDGTRVAARKSVRGEDRGVMMASGDPADVDRFLTMTFASGVRAGRGLARLRPLRPSGGPPGSIAPGFVLVGDLDRGFELVSHGTDGERRRYFASDIEAGRFSYYAQLDAGDLRRRVVRASDDLLAQDVEA